MFDDKLEPDLAPHFTVWKKDPSQDNSAAMLDALQPTIEGAIRTHVGDPNPLLTSQARRLTLGALKTYDPKRGRLKNHVYNQLLGLKRIARKQSTILSVPERISLDRSKLENATTELSSELGREPSDQELADKTGIPFARMRRVRTYNPAVAEGSMDDPATGAGYSGAVFDPHRDSGRIWSQIVYDSLDAHHQKVMEHALGMNGRQRLSNQAIAAKLKRTPGAISQAKARIQSRLDEQDELSPF